MVFSCVALTCEYRASSGVALDNVPTMRDLQLRRTNVRNTESSMAWPWAACPQCMVFCRVELTCVVQTCVVQSLLRVALDNVFTMHDLQLRRTDVRNTALQWRGL